VNHWIGFSWNQEETFIGFFLFPNVPISNVLHIWENSCFNIVLCILFEICNLLSLKYQESFQPLVKNLFTIKLLVIGIIFLFCWGPSYFKLTLFQYLNTVCTDVELNCIACNCLLFRFISCWFNLGPSYVTPFCLLNFLYYGSNCMSMWCAFCDSYVKAMMCLRFDVMVWAA